MLCTKVDSSKYVSEFKERFSNFAQKAPILLSFVTTDREVQIIHENTGIAYNFEWDFTIPVKSFIHEIKQSLSDNHYPRVVLEREESVQLTPEEQADLLAQGTAIDQLPVVKKLLLKELYRIDKVIALKDVLILVEESTQKTFRYKMNYSCIYFLKNYRTGKYKTLEEAGAFFFSHSTLLNELAPPS